MHMRRAVKYNVMISIANVVNFVLLKTLVSGILLGRKRLLGMASNLKHTVYSKSREKMGA